ncbi:vgr related protein [Parasphingopyxis algicola]|uniref:vgr related protein n=1 Tax=Parasphingopyxis algicola TaxID=2026624 RepID=UPI0015A1E654|nr:vgr related protein [Parasphingopyxis algicola]QLC23742.1 vgr related protein [Parasphingopyxis algicola]
MDQSAIARPLAAAERKLAASIFGEAIDYDAVKLHRRKWFPFQPANTVMAPTGGIWFHPKGPFWRDDFGTAPLKLQALFVHEMTHVWQYQSGIFLPLRRHPFCRYHYSLKPGWPLKRYGLEQQAEIVRHTFLLRQGGAVAGAASVESYEAILPFKVG